MIDGIDTLYATWRGMCALHEDDCHKAWLEVEAPKYYTDDLELAYLEDLIYTAQQHIQETNA